MQAPFSIQKAFGSFIAELRERAGLHIEQLAEKSGLSGMRLHAIERGDVNLSLGTMLVLAMSLDTSPQELFSGIAKRINVNPRPQIDAFHHYRSESLRVQNKPKQLWVGAVEVRPLCGCEIFDYSQGAFVNVVTWAADVDQYAKNVAQALAKMRLFVMSIENPEPVDAKRKKDGSFAASIEEIIAEAAQNPQATLCGEFYTFAKTDA